MDTKTLTTIFRCVFFVMFLPSCFWIEPQGSQAQGANTSSNGNKCQLTLKITSFASVCARMEIENSGVNAVDSWLLEMQIKPGTTIISHWGAQISLVDNLIYIQPTEQQPTLDPQQITTFGFCLSTPAAAPILHAGACGDEIDASENAETNVTIQTETDPNTVPDDAL